MAKGKLIVLNGGSSSGKTAIARAFQDLAPDCWMQLGIDVFWYAIPPSQLDMQQVRPEYNTWDAEVDADGVAWFSLTPGPLLERVMRARYKAIRVYLDEGINVIADDLFWKRDWLVDFLRIFEGGVRRESERYSRIVGTNRGSARAAHADAEYDFELDTTDIPVPELARVLHERYQACRPGAFDRLRKRFLS
jgi:chloramphenicol 3-O phosphotransferase